MLRQEVKSLNDPSPKEEQEVTSSQMATFLVHLKEHGITYAVVLLVAQQLGLLFEVVAVASGMC
jgi:hypothetical protein